MIYFIFIVLFVLTLLMCRQESKKRKISFLSAILICIFTTPFLGLGIIMNRPLRNPVGCNWCGNMENEAEFCGVCGKNKDGETRIISK